MISQLNIPIINDHLNPNSSSIMLSSRTRNSNSNLNGNSKSQTPLSKDCFRNLANELSFEKDNEKFNTYINIKPKVFTVLEDITRKYKHLKTGKQTKRPSSFNENRMADKNGIEEIHIKYKKQRPLDIVKDLEIPRLKKDTKDISHEVAELSNSKSTIELGRVDLFTFCKIRNYYKNIYFEYPKRNNVNVEDQSSKLLQMNNTMNTQQNRVFRSSFKHKNMNNNNETNMIDKNDSMYLPLSKIFQEDPSQKWIELSPDYQEKFTFIPFIIFCWTL